MTTYDEGIQAILDSARGKLEKLRADMRTFTETQRDKVEVKKTGENSWQFQRKDNFDVPPMECNLLIREVVNDLRSALDYLVHKLVRENGRNPTPRNIFPIIWDIDKILEEVLSAENGPKYVRDERKKADKALEGVGEREKFRILWSQGFDVRVGEYGDYDIRTNPSEFRQLAYLSNVTKHRHLISAKLESRGNLTPEYRSREREASSECLPEPRNTDFEIKVCFHFEKDEDQPSHLFGSVDDKLTSMFLAVTHTIDYVSGKSSRPFADFTNDEKYQLRRWIQWRPL